MKWNFAPDKCEILEKVALKEKVHKNKHSDPIVRSKTFFEGNAAKIIPMT